MLVRAREEHDWPSRVQYALKPRNDVCSDERVEVSDVRVFRTVSASMFDDGGLGMLTGIGVKYRCGDIERLVRALYRAVPSDEGNNTLDCMSLERKKCARSSRTESSAGVHPA